MVFAVFILSINRDSYVRVYLLNLKPAPDPKKPAGKENIKVALILKRIYTYYNHSFRNI